MCGSWLAAQFGGDDHLLHAVRVHAEGGDAARADRGVRALGGALDVVRVVVAPAHDDDVLDAAADEEAVLRPEAEVAGAHVRALVPAVDRRRLEGLAGEVGALPVADGDAVARDPDLADLPRTAPRTRPRVDDGHVQGPAGAAADEDARGRAVVRHAHRGAAFELVLVEGPDPGPFEGRPAHEQCAFGEPVHRNDGFRAEPGGGEFLREPLHGIGADGFGAVRRDQPGRKVQARTFLVGRFSSAQVECEIGGRGKRSADVDIARSQRTGLCRNATVGMETEWIPVIAGTMIIEISPMS
ncbi:hypothetical protein OHA32_02690 [Streptomyces erythrochromogenes]|nr:hypothetical protein [Streptomyces erythrochromogenes]MCX5582299.1 hypothetical protein [Streptomyces erythrochromogenes]